MRDTFRFFIRKNWGDNSLNNEDLDALGVEFEEYLNETLSDEAKNLILPKGVEDVILNQDHPLKQHGFHPAYVIHFTQFISLLKHKIS